MFCLSSVYYPIADYYKHLFHGKLCVPTLINEKKSPILLKGQVSKFHISGAFELGRLAIFVVGHQARDVFLQADLPVHLQKDQKVRGTEKSVAPETRKQRLKSWKFGRKKRPFIEMIASCRWSWVLLAIFVPCCQMLKGNIGWASARTKLCSPFFVSRS